MYCTSAAGWLWHMWERRGTCTRGGSISQLRATYGCCRGTGTSIREGGSKGTAPVPASGTSQQTSAEHKTPSRLLQLMRGARGSDGLLVLLSRASVWVSIDGGISELGRRKSTGRSRSVAARTCQGQAGFPEVFSC